MNSVAELLQKSQMQYKIKNKYYTEDFVLFELDYNNHSINCILMEEYLMKYIRLCNEINVLNCTYIKQHDRIFIKEIKLFKEVHKLIHFNFKNNITHSQQTINQNSNTEILNADKEIDDDPNLIINRSSNIIKSNSFVEITKISDLKDMYKKYKILGRVKGEPEQKEVKGNLSLLIFIMEDDTSEIECNIWGDSAKTVRNTLKSNLEYVLTGGSIKLQSQTYFRTNHKYKINFNNPQVEEIRANITNIISDIKLVSLGEIKTNNQKMDCVVVCVKNNPLKELQMNGTFKIKVLKVIDESIPESDIVLYDRLALQLENDPTCTDNSILLFRNVSSSLSEKQGRSYKLSAHSSIVVDPHLKTDDQEVQRRSHELKEWWNQRTSSQPIIVRLPTQLNEVNQDAIDRVKADNKTNHLIGFSSFISSQDIENQKFPYQYACPSGNCYKKVERDSTMCAHCNRSFETPRKRQLFKMNIRDRFESIICDTQHDQAERITTMTCDEYENVTLEKGNDYLQDKLLYRPFITNVTAQVDEQKGFKKNKARLKSDISYLYEMDGGTHLEHSFDALIKIQDKQHEFFIEHIK